MQTSNEYIPGTCNIGPAEIKKRKMAVIIALILTTVVVILVLVLHPQKLWRLSLFLPVLALTIGFQQVYFKFCANYGLNGLFNFGDLGKNDTVEQAEFRRKDKKKAIQIIVFGTLSGIVAALIFYFLPF